jgi:thioredoxin 1
MLVEISDDNFEELVKKSESPFVLLFSSPWCETCKNVRRRIESVSELSNNVKFGGIDISANLKTPSELQVLSIPTIIIFKNGEENARIVGDAPEKELKQKIASV